MSINKLFLVLLACIVIVYGGILLPELIKIYCELILKTSTYLENINV